MKNTILVAAIYIRKSNEQLDTHADQKSVERQREHAIKYATEMGWRVEERFIFVDDGVTGADFTTREGFLNLMEALKVKGGPGFQVLIMSEASRLGRKMWETGYAFAQIAAAKVRLFFYLERAEADLDSPEGQLMLTLKLYAAQVERTLAQRRTRDGLTKRHASGLATGQAWYGVELVPVNGPTGERSHTDFRIAKAHVPVVLRIFAEAAAGDGRTRIMRGLNREGIGTRSGARWEESGIARVLHNEKLRGWITYRPDLKSGRVERVHRPDLQIVPDDLWTRAHAKLSRLRLVHAPRFGAKVPGRGRDTASRYVLTGFLRCACGAPYLVRYSGRPGAYRMFYKCAARAVDGRESPCTNTGGIDMAALDAAILAEIDRTFNDPATVQEILAGVLREETAIPASTRAKTEDKIARLTAGIARLVALASEADVPEIAAKLATMRAERETLTADLQRRAPTSARERKTVEREIAGALTAIALSTAADDVAETRTNLRAVLDGPIIVAPGKGDTVTFKGRIAYGEVLAGVCTSSGRTGSRTLVTGTREFSGTLARRSVA